MDRLFDLAFVRPPAESYLHCVSSNPKRNKIDVNLARAQHRQYVSILRECGVKVVEFQALEAFPDSVFMQDPALVGSRNVIIGRFGKPKRRGEEKAFADELDEHRNIVGALGLVTPPGTLEGGDVMITDHGIFVGESSRTNIAGIEQLKSRLPRLKVERVTTSLLHLLCGCSYLTDRNMVICPELVDPDAFAGFRFIRIPKQDAYACDALYLGERRVIIPSGYPETTRKLRDAGYRPIEVEMSEFHKGDGGVTCLSSPVYTLF